ncbi:hypothetical protein D3C86_1263040 [compost metagenome]
MAVQLLEIRSCGFVNLLQKRRRRKKQRRDPLPVGKGRDCFAYRLFRLDQRLCQFRIQPGESRKVRQGRRQAVEDRVLFARRFTGEFQMQRPDLLRPLRPMPHSLRSVIIT